MDPLEQRYCFLTIVYFLICHGKSKRPFREVVRMYYFPVPEAGTSSTAAATIFHDLVVITGCKGAGLLVGAFETQHLKQWLQWWLTSLIMPTQ